MAEPERAVALQALRETGPEATQRLLRAEREALKEKLITATDRRVAEIQGAIKVIDELLRDLTYTPRTLE
ncbi:MAG TPA: hypothetical protein VFG60_07125 [Burkholderiaceae bacterium]|nr:hypothetical protein [Burkholderiaceae bacterium]